MMFLSCLSFISKRKQIKWDDTEPYIVPITSGYVIKVYDGDTITIASKLPYKNSKMYRFSVRLNGIDSPEMKGKSEDEKQAAIHSRDALSSKILHKHVFLRNVQSEKYGRVLADVYDENDLCLNTWMIEQSLAVPYDGGAKKLYGC